MLKGNQQSVVAGRSIQEIIKRFGNKIKDPRRASKGKNVSKIIKEFLKINCPINKTAEKLNAFFKKNKINLIVGPKYFPISDNKISKLNVEFSASFGRQLEYYTGMVFKINIKKNSKSINVINGHKHRIYSYPIYITLMVIIGFQLIKSPGQENFQIGP